MATFLDVTLLQGLSDIFLFILVLAIVFGVLEMSFLKDKKGINILLSFLFAFFVYFTGPTRELVAYLVPWFAVIAVVIFLLLFMFMALGMDISEVDKLMGLKVTAMVVGIILIVFGAGAALGGSGEPELDQNGMPIEQPAKENTMASTVVAVFTHPKFLGVAFLLLLGSFTITYLSSQS